LQHVQRLNKGPVLDVGAAQGMLGRALVDSGLTLDAIELNPSWAKDAEPYYRKVFTCGVEEAALDRGAYRTVVCGDVLEHTADPLGVLKQLVAASAPDATFIISLPNVAHLSIRLMLLAGRFPKMDRGILDRTHLHFFTRDTARDLLEQAGLRVTSSSATGVPLDELWKGGEGKLAFRVMLKTQHAALAVLPRVFGFQWVMTAERVR
jgi:2-polyprenyl-3-methyl-5-hydroxy-6-metoxy-1,4-benzoquinol methylase